MRIRRATLQDFEAGRWLMEESIDEGASALGVTLNEDRALMYLANQLDDADSLSLVVESKNDDTGTRYMVGLLFADVLEHPYLDTRFTNVSLFYVLPEWRTPKLAAELLRLVEQYAEQHTAMPLIQQTSGLRTASFGRWLERRGYYPIGGCFVKQESEHDRRAIN